MKYRHIFGKCFGDVYTLEYQKNGLSYAHILTLLHREDVSRSAEQANEFFRAQIPTDDSELASIVKSHLTHGLCGLEYPKAPCMRDGKCSK